MQSYDLLTSTEFRAAVDRQEARAALALEAHIRLTHDIVRLQASQTQIT